MLFQKKSSSSRRRSRERTRHYVYRAIVVLCLGSIGGLLYYGMKTGRFGELSRRDASAAANSEHQPVKTAALTNTVANAEEREFQAFLDNSSPQRLILRSTELIDNDSADLLERLDRQSMKIRIAESLLRIKDDTRSNNYGRLSKLKALRDREIINFDHGLTTESSIAELQTFAFSSDGAGEQTIADESQLGKLYGRLIRTLVFEETSNVKVIEPVLREFKAVCEQHVQDADLAREIYGLLERIHVRLPESTSRSFISEFQRIFHESPSSEIRELAETADEKIIEAEFDFVDVFGSLSVDKSDAMDELFQQIRENLQRPNISAQGFKSIFQQIQNLGTFGRYDQALVCTELLQRRLSTRESLLPIVRQAQELRQKYQLAGARFDLSAIQKAATGEAFQFRFADAPVKAMLFFDADSVGATRKSIEFVLGIAGRGISTKQFCFSLVMLDDGRNSSRKQEFLKLDKLIRAVDTGIIDVRSEIGNEFVERYSLQSLPRLILLDRSGRVAAVNLDLVDFERRYDEMLGTR